MGGGCGTVSMGPSGAHPISLHLLPFQLEDPALLHCNTAPSTLLVVEALGGGLLPGNPWRGKQGFK